MIRITNELKRQLAEADKLLKREQSLRGGCSDSGKLMGIFTPAGENLSWEETIAAGRRAKASYYCFISRLKGEGILLYTPKSKGGCGWSVNQKYVDKEQQEVKTVVVDRTQNIRSKLAEPSAYATFNDVLRTLLATVPEATIKELVTFLTCYPEFKRLAMREDVAGVETATIQKELETYRLDHVTFTTYLNGEERQKISQLTLWQLYRVMQALYVEPPKSAEQPLKDAPVIIEPVFDTGSDPVTTDAPF